MRQSEARKRTAAGEKTTPLAKAAKDYSHLIHAPNAWAKATLGIETEQKRAVLRAWSVRRLRQRNVMRRNDRAKGIRGKPERGRDRSPIARKSSSWRRRGN